MNATRDVAIDILDTCTQATSRTLVAWALGAHADAHALAVWEILHGGHTHDAGGTYMPGGRSTCHDNGRVLLRQRADGDFAWIQHFAWDEVHALLRRDLIGEALHAEIDAALTLRVERTLGFDPHRPSTWWHTDEGEERMRLFDEIDEVCAELGERAWAACRPPEHEEPTDLLGVLAAMGGTS